MAILYTVSNCGFFSIFTSDYVKKIDGVEINPYLIRISELAKEFLNNNSFFHNSLLENFKIIENMI